MRRLALTVLQIMTVMAVPAQAAERLLVPQLTGWKTVVGHVDPGAEVTELIPERESADNWSRRITVVAFRGVGHTVPGFLDMVAARSAEICDDASADAPRMGKLGNSDAGSRFIACGRFRGDGRGEYTLYYAIRGRDAFYVISRAWRGQPFGLGIVPLTSQELGDWIAYLRAVSLCDSGDPARPCP